MPLLLKKVIFLTLFLFLTGEAYSLALASPDTKSAQSGDVWLPHANETLTYDAAGNRQANAQFDYGWDAKNQLTRIRTKNHSTAPHAYDITLTYDAEGRRVKKHVIQYANGAIISEKIITFLWDDWDLLYERHQLPSGLTLLERKFLWGPDIADGEAGGAGGLLLIIEKKGSTTTEIIPLYDGTGHVIALTDIEKNLLASYAYGPFGERISVQGSHANTNPWRWATKYLDEETGLYYFGQRYYDSITGQWLSREPLGEEESLNLYSYCHNDPVNHVDILGLAKVATDGKGNLTAIGKFILEAAKQDEEAAKSLLMAYQVQAEMKGVNIGQLLGNGDQTAAKKVHEAISLAVGTAQMDGRTEWGLITSELGMISYFSGYKDAWTQTLLAESMAMLSERAATHATARAESRAASAERTAYQNSWSFKWREFADVPFDVAAFTISAAAATDVTTGNAVIWNSWNYGGGFELQEVSAGERAFAASMVVFGPITRSGSLVDDFARVVARGRSFAGTAVRPWGARSGQQFVLVGQGKLSNKVPTSGSWFKADGSPHWPRNNGFVGNAIEGEMAVGFRIDRYGGRYVDGVFQDYGGFTAPVGASFTSRALPSSSRNFPLSTYEVIKPFNVKAGPARPWFGEAGLGIQFQHLPIQDLIDGGYIRLINRH